MNLEQMKAHVWQRAPLGKFMVGRETIEDLVELTIENWEPEYLNSCQDDAAWEAVCASMLASVKRGHQLASGKDTQEYGFVWMFLLQMLASAVIQIILRYWQERASNRVWIVTMQAEMTR